MPCEAEIQASLALSKKSTGGQISLFIATDGGRGGGASRGSNG